MDGEGGSEVREMGERCNGVGDGRRDQAEDVQTQ